MELPTSFYPFPNVRKQGNVYEAKSLEENQKHFQSEGRENELSSTVSAFLTRQQSEEIRCDFEQSYDRNEELALLRASYPRVA